MSFQIKEYDLPDARLLQAESGDDYIIWRPDHTAIVLGASNNPLDSIIIAAVKNDDIPVYKRPSGGETVILTPNTLVISAVLAPVRLQDVRKRFRAFNDQILAAVTAIGIRNVAHRGISDLAIGEQKILGSAVYHSRDRLFYHSVLNVGETTQTIARYIKHPGREPDYRQGRRHSEFITSLKSVGYQGNYDSIINRIAFHYQELYSV
ncbi:MAG: hypothetical protein HQ528_09645 [Candidatus Marinimicrobia bacterium]|nr:hypothetical protein [Candidatus Neomarinimicrobiota bacterium]